MPLKHLKGFFGVLSMLDVSVVGGGPAGAVCARGLAEAGLNAAVLEEHSRPGVPVKCSGLISLSGLDALGIDYSRAVQNRLHGAIIHAPGGTTMTVGNGKARAAAVDRAVLDELLLDAAEGAGAEIHLNERVRDPSLLDARVVVGADGPGSLVASRGGFPPISDFAVCMQADYSGLRLETRERLHMFLSNARYPGFFGWVIPTGSDTARVGLGVHTIISRERGAEGGTSERVDALFARFLLGDAAPFIEGAKRESTLAGAIPLAPRAETVRGSTLLVGDAAGQVKATTGGGVVFGAVAAKSAARCIASGRVGEYEKAWRAELGRDGALHGKIRVFLNSLTDERMDSLFSLAKMFGAEAFLNEFGDMDRPAKMEEKLKGYGPIYAMYKQLVGA